MRCVKLLMRCVKLPWGSWRLSPRAIPCHYCADLGMEVQGQRPLSQHMHEAAAGMLRILAPGSWLLQCLLGADKHWLQGRTSITEARRPGSSHHQA